MAFRSGINQVNGSNASPIRIFNQTTTPAVSGTRNTIPITLGSGTYKCSLSYRFDCGGTAQSVFVSFIESGLSSSAIASVPVAPMPLTSSKVPFGDAPAGSATILSGTGFTEFDEIFISLSAPTTFYLFNVLTFTSNTTPPVTFTQSVTITEIKG